MAGAAAETNQNTTMKTVTIKEYHALLRQQKCEKEFLTMRCPACGTIQSARDLIAAGAGKDFDEVEKYLGFSCVGRWTHEKGPPREKGTQEGCNWTLGGLFQIHEFEVIDEEGKHHPNFEPCQHKIEAVTVTDPEKNENHTRIL